ncbi:translation initiation factor IF-6 [Candidatus Woesearchaeota archaeon]|jgi:translation initiation factor 6|nr:translation initiation factor IF-6 [Candidatus Woesearchaeota archaeon]MBT4387660.1 translation initiation factor IF-6 [Candidatus Woesearchaeota archaeon]MBT4595977.1 translation initiation factor IF-6 [Candidatus Woesearchaeota archaeon]MBT5741107.1 translation initiation factor IF-6 [Candidatus Woesearchaeota archaeon]MBT6505368.1 translation initiation factor IF-6 [Candidatus Woesearchaeota archaeon]
MNARKMSFHSNSNIGLFAYVNEKFCLIGNVITEEQKKEIEETLEVPVYEILIAGTPLIGIFVNGNEDKIIIPSITKKEELEKLDELQIEYQIVDSKYTALGNNILIGNNQAFVNQNLEKEAIKQIEDFLKIKLHNIDLGELDTLGSIGVIHNDTGVIGEFIGQNKLNNLNKISDIKFSLGTINQGSDYIKSGIFKNSKGFVIGEMTSGVEIINIEQELFR